MPNEVPGKAARKLAGETGGTTNTHNSNGFVIRGIAGAAEFLGLGKRTVSRLLSANALPHRRCGRAVLFLRTELEAWLDANCPDYPGAADAVRAAMQKGGHR